MKLIDRFKCNRLKLMFNLFDNYINSIIKAKWLIIVPFIIYFVLVIGRVYSNMPWCDEAWFASSSVNLVKNGVMGNTNYISNFWQNFDKYTYWQPPLYFLVQALTFILFGVGLFQIRFISVFWGLIGLIAIYYIVKEVFNNNRKIIILSLLLVGTNYKYLYGASYGRMDMMSASLSLIGLALYIILRKNKFNIAVILSNLFICISGLTHPNGIIGLIVLVFSVFYFDRRKVNLKIILLAAVPYFIGAIGWSFYIFQDVETFKQQFLGNIYRPESASYIMGIKFAAVYYEVVNRYFYFNSLFSTKYRLLFLFKSSIYLFFFLNLLIAPFVIGKSKQRFAWYLLVIVFLTMAFVIANKSASYIVWSIPFFIINTIVVWSILKHNKILHKMYLLFFVYILALSVAGSVYSTFVENKYQTLYLSDLINFHKKHYKGGKIYGSGEITFFYNFDDNIIQDNPMMGFYIGVKPNYFVIEKRYKKRIYRYKKTHPNVWDYINKNLSEKYNKVYQGNYYTFYERE